MFYDFFLFFCFSPSFSDTLFPVAVIAESVRGAHGGAALSRGPAARQRWQWSRARQPSIGIHQRGIVSILLLQIHASLALMLLCCFRRELARDLLRSVEARNRALLERERARLRHQRDRELLYRKEAHENLLAMLGVADWEGMLRSAASSV